jgi:ribose/xylose/arabinose/galactoside ABC-type transport system permease subunit
MPVIAAVLIIGNFLNPAFLTALILICGKFDLSLKSTVGLAPMVAAWLMIKDCSICGSGVGINGYEGIAVVWFSSC